MADNKIIIDDIWADDKLGIKENVIGFADILKWEKFTEDGTSKVYSISAEFGIGKTFFCDKLKDVLKQDNIPVSMLNIWKMDFYENPLVPLLINLQKTYAQYSAGPRIFPNPTKLLNAFKTIVSGISIEANAPLFGKIVIDGEKMVNCHENLKKNVKDSSIYTEYEQFEEELNNLKTFLKNWAKEADKPIVIIIDELDRCRPDYAVKTLEILKHFFDISGFVFVLSIDEGQLKSSVETLFGTKNFDGYKRKFINNSFILPNPDKEKFTNFLYEKSGLENVIKHIEDTNKDLIFKVRRDNYKDFINRSFFGEDNAKEIEKCVNFNKLQTTESIIKRYFTAYSIWFKFTLRQMEQVFDRLVLFTKTIADTDMLFSPDLAVYCICLHEFDLKIYTRIKNKNSLNHNEYSLSLIAGNASSISYELYKEESFNKFTNLNRILIPKCPGIPDFSITNNQYNPQIVICDNIDRFFVIDRENPLKWLRDAVVDHQKNPIDNKCRIGIVAHSKAEAKWVNIEPDIDTESKFNLEQFKQTYFDKIEFISNFK